MSLVQSYRITFKFEFQNIFGKLPQQWTAITYSSHHVKAIYFQTGKINFREEVHEEEQSNWQLAWSTDTEKGINIFQFLSFTSNVFILLWYYYEITKFLLKFSPAF